MRSSSCGSGATGRSDLFSLGATLYHMLAGRPDILSALVDRGMYLVIIGKDQVYTDLPENRNARNPDYLNEFVLVQALLGFGYTI